ncbi:centromere protein M isoform X2 [Hyla sarda]|uniref:centromere protein M isoform X2 n=1 Tax=Hyla sarda TaxID=327740 RepID=UPI0024C35B22|nr:centromere protein M isoform X2 [Hyla sarda]
MAGNAAVLRPFEKIPALNVATVLLVGSEESHRELIANAMLKERTDFAVKIHMTTALPLPFEREHLRPRMASVTSSIALLDAHFFLGKVCFLSTKGRHGKIQHCLVDISTVKDLADKYLSPLIQTELENEDDVMCTAKRLLNMLKICAGLVPGISSLYTGTIRKYV